MLPTLALPEKRLLVGNLQFVNCLNGLVNLEPVDLGSRNGWVGPEGSACGPVHRIHQHGNAAIRQAVVGVEAGADVPGVHGQFADAHIQHSMDWLRTRRPVAQVVPLPLCNGVKQVNRLVQALEQDFLQAVSEFSAGIEGPLEDVAGELVLIMFGHGSGPGRG